MKAIILFCAIVSFATAIECINGKFAVSITRTFGMYPYEERLYIYEGTETTGNPVFSIVEASTSATQTHEFCVNPVTHTVHLNDDFGNGWDNGSAATIYLAGFELAHYHLDSGYNAYETLQFTNIYPYSSSWKHTNQAQTGSSWTTQAVSWTDSANFPNVITNTRYFRKTLSLSNFANVYYAYITVKTHTGFLLYLNGQLAWNWNMPISGTITADTYALSKETSTVERSLGTLVKLWTDTATVEVAIEVHGTADSLGGSENFDCQIICKSSSDLRRIDNGGTASASSFTTGNEGTAMIYDNLASTKWCFSHSTGTVWTAWTFNNGRRETINKYQIVTGNDAPARDPITWNVYGSFDGQTYYLLDTRTQVAWNYRHETRTFIMNNVIPFNSYKLEITAKAGTDNCMQFAEWNLLVSPMAIPTLGLNYPQTTYALSKDIDEVDISPSYKGFSGLTISGTLPAGLTFDTTTGRIYGIPTTVMDPTAYTISGTFLMDSKAYTTVLTISVVACGLPNSLFASFTKSNGDSGTESFQILNASEQLVLNGLPGSQPTMTYNVCLPAGTYTVKMLSSAGTTWSTSSFLTINYIFGDSSFTVARTRLNVNTERTFNLVADYALPFASANTAIKYLADGSVPANWSTASFADSAWTSLVDASRPSVAQKIQLYRTTFSVASTTGYDGYELNVKAQAGVVVYLNGNEVYRSALPAGDLTPTTSATSGAESAYWRTITGKRIHVNEGSNTLAVGIVRVSDAAAPIDFDVSFRLMKETNITPRYWGVTTTSSSGVASYAFDLDPYTTSRVALGGDTHITVQFNNRAEFVNRYCFNTNTDNANEDPRDWSIKGSNDGTTWDTLKSEANVYFEMRATEYCFYMPTVAKAYSYLRFQPTAAASSMGVSIGDLLFFLENLDGVTIPELTFDPNVLVGYTGSAFPEVTATSPYYTTFTITPALPTTLVMSSNTGSIKGVPTQPYPTTIHTISAINPLGETKSTTVSVTVNVCAGDLVSFSLEFFLESGANKCSFDLKDLTTEEIIESRANMVEYQTFTIPLCRNAGQYGLILRKTDNTGWGSNRVTVRLADGSELLSESLAAGQLEKQYNFNVRYEVAPLFTEWSYLVDGTAAPEGWNTVAGAPSTWQVATPNSFPAATGVTQYYYKKFTVNSALEDFSIMEVSVTTYAGMVVYLNGEIINSMNIKTEGMTSETTATTQLNIPTTYIIGLNLLAGNLVMGENILAVELHRHTTNEATNSFDASAILVLDNMYMVKDGVGTTNPSSEGNEGSDKAFDNNSDTKFYYNGKCVGLEMTWTYNNNRREPITNYGLISANDCNPRHPSGWKLHASNDGKDWVEMHAANDVFFTAYWQQKRFDYYNELAYNRFRVTITACDNVDLPTAASCGEGNRFQIADYYLFAKRVEPDCPREDGYPPAMAGDQAYADCPELYTGTRYKMCTASGFGEEWNGCVPKSPVRVQYETLDYVFIQGETITPLVPVIIGAEVTVSIYPDLPAGLTMDKDTGTISGTPTEVKDTRNYIVTAKNKSGSVQTRINIGVTKPPVNWVLIGLLIAVAVVAVFAIMLAVLRKTRKGKVKAGNRAKKTAKKNMKVTEKAKPTTEVKV